MLACLQAACDRFAGEREDFWYLAGLLDASFETGRSKYFTRGIQSLKRAKFPDESIRRLELGVNGNIVEILDEDESVEIMSADQNFMGLRPDILLNDLTDSFEGIVEVKAVNDLTYPSFYGHKDDHGIADDCVKLRRFRSEGFLGRLFQIVFFLELPDYFYPSGKSISPDWIPHLDRQSYQCRKGIDKQYAEVRKYLCHPCSAMDAPCKIPLSLPSDAFGVQIEQWFRDEFLPDDSTWHFAHFEQLKNASVGFAIWEYH